MTQPIHTPYIAEGFMQDCENLTYSLTGKYDKVDWEKFCHDWKDMEFDILFYGRQSGAELVEFTEELLQCARLYMITETENYEEQVVGVFIAYAITVIQPYKDLCSLRLIPEDVAPLKKFEAKARSDNRTDVLMILARLYIYSTQFHACLRERAMDVTIRKYFDDSITIPKSIHKRWRGVLTRESLRGLTEIEDQEKLYLATKSDARERIEKLYPGKLRMYTTFESDTPRVGEYIRSKVYTTQDKQEEKPRDEEKYGVDSVKRRAMENTVDPVKFLHGVQARQQATEEKAHAESPPKPAPTVLRTYKAKTKAKKKQDTEPYLDYLSGKKKETGNMPPELPDLYLSGKKKETSKKAPDLPDLGSSLPTLDDMVFQGPSNTLLSREGSPEPTFKGFSPQEIQRANSSLTNSVIDEAYVRNKDILPKEVSGNISPVSVRPYRKSFIPYKMKKNCELKNQRNRIAKNKNNSRLRIVSSDSDSNTSNDEYHSDDCSIGKKRRRDDTESDDANERKKPKTQDTETYTRKELTVHSKGEVKHLVQFEINNIVIQTDKNSPPNIEIEYIDNYTGDLHDTCEVRDENYKIEKEENEYETVSDKELEDELMKAAQDIKDDESEAEKADMVVPKNAKIKLKNMKKMERRNLKRVYLRSRLKKMGILPLANF